MIRHPGIVTLVLLATTAPRGAVGQDPRERSLPAPWQEVGNALGTTGTAGEGFYRYGWPRRDLRVRVGTVEVAPALALGSWAAFSGDPARATVMGDLVLAADELGPVLQELARQNIDVTAVHNHLAGEIPQVMYVHFHGQGEAADLARRLDAVLERTATPRPVRPAGVRRPGRELSVIFRELGRSGQADGPVAKVSYQLVRRPVLHDGQRLPPDLVVASPVNVQILGGDRVAATGDFAVTENQARTVLRTMAEHGLTATAVHTHLLGERPKVVYIHFWADGPRERITRAIRAVVEASGGR